MVEFDKRGRNLNAKMWADVNHDVRMYDRECGEPVTYHLTKEQLAMVLAGEVIVDELIQRGEVNVS